MVQQWYYWHESAVLGPFSGQQLVDLATAGDIQRDDVVWKDGVEGGVPAHKVNHLFAAPLLATPGVVALASEAMPAAGTAVAAVADGPATAVVPPVEAPVSSSWDRGRANSRTGGGRATAGKGAVIVGQDGKTVKFRLKCITCGFEDSSWKTMTIARGTSRHSFYCPKCRKRGNGEINGYLG